jgi:proteasome assembly chaperone (PAC2) family protein
MIIQDRLYSENSSEVLYSVTMSEPEYMVYQGWKKRPLDEVKSNRGLGRSAVLGALGGNALGAMAGGYVGKIAANDADAAGLSDKQIISKSARAGAMAGAATGVARGLIGQRNPAGMLAGTVMGATGGYFGAKKNTRSRLKKRNKE